MNEFIISDFVKYGWTKDHVPLEDLHSDSVILFQFKTRHKVNTIVLQRANNNMYESLSIYFSILFSVIQHYPTWSLRAIF